MNDPSVPESVEDDTRSRSRRRRRRIGIGVLVVLLAIIVPPFIHVGRFQHNILRSISSGLGRPVDARSVDLVLLPWPGFVLHDFTVSEDPAFGAEPVLIADKVTATLRLSTFWHRRIDIASLRFDHPSLNLVRDAEGHWNFESLLHNSPALIKRESSVQGNSQTPPDSAPFPYVEATGARINVKFGAEKLPLSLEDADLALWKESAKDWRVRLKARPVRTDLTAASTGQIRVHVSLSSNGTLMHSPIQIKLEWRRAQLGGIEQLLLGNESGWWGAVNWTAEVRGTLSDARLRSDIAIEGFRRAEFLPPDEMDLSAHCDARVVRGNRDLDSLECKAPLGSGNLLLRGPGAVREPASHTGVRHDATRPGKQSRTLPWDRNIPSYSPIQITVQKVPAGFFLDVLRHMHPGVASDARLSGEVNGAADCNWRGEDTLATCTGTFQSGELHLRLPHLSRPLVFSPLVIESTVSPIAASISGPRPAILQALTHRRRRYAAGSFHSAAWNLLPTKVSLGGATPATVSGAVALTGAALQIKGPADAATLVRLGQILKVPAISGEIQSVHGDADLSLSVQSRWLPAEDTGWGNASDSESGTEPGAEEDTADSDVPTAPTTLGEPGPTRWTGNLNLEKTTLNLATLPVPVHIASAKILLTPTAVEWSGIHGTFAGFPFNGNLQWQIPCTGSSATCARSFTFHTSDLDADRLQAILRRNGGQPSLLSRLNPWASGPPRLPEIAGTVHADALSAGPLSMKEATLKVRIEGRRANLAAISGQIFGGTLSGGSVTSPAVPGSTSTGSIDWGGDAPAYVLRATLHHIHPERVAAVWHEDWGHGTANVGFDLKTHGWSADDLARNADGTFAFAWTDGSFPTTGVASEGSTERFHRWIARGTVRNQTLTLESSRMSPHESFRRKHSRATGMQSVSGTITFSRTLHLLLQPSDIQISGPLSASTIAPAKKPRAGNT